MHQYVGEDKKNFVRARLYGIGSKSLGGPQGGVKPGGRAYRILSGPSFFIPGAQFRKKLSLIWRVKTNFCQKRYYGSLYDWPLERDL